MSAEPTRPPLAKAEPRPPAPDIARVVCGECGRLTHPAELIVNDDDGAWNCLRCVEDRRVATTKRLSA